MGNMADSGIAVFPLAAHEQTFEGALHLFGFRMCLGHSKDDFGPRRCDSNPRTRCEK